MTIPRSTRVVLALGIAAAVFSAGTYAVHAQAPRIRYVSGTNVQPVFEGWERQKDGTFDLIFGYLNRNLGEDVIVPVGASNSMEPGGPDRGQPAYFYAGRHEFFFRVNVPKDFGKGELVWSVTVRGETEKAVGNLLPVWEVDRQLIVSRTVPQARLDTVSQNQPPTLAVEPVPPVALPSPATLKATVSDDGIPGPRPPRPQRSGGENAAPFLNAPLPPPPPGPPAVLSVSWQVYRGPAAVTFEPSGFVAVKSGQQAVATARFSQPGVYELRATAHDGILQTTRHITVTVK
jgi:hypothetical protein